MDHYELEDLNRKAVEKIRGHIAGSREPVESLHDRLCEGIGNAEHKLRPRPRAIDRMNSRKD